MHSATNFGDQRHERSPNAAQTKHKQRDLRRVNILLGGMQYQQVHLWRALRKADQFLSYPLKVADARQVLAELAAQSRNARIYSVSHYDIKPQICYKVRDCLLYEFDQLCSSS